ncbi:MAG: MFS transporter [Bradymonadales bacterium]|nr:MFS transporter [Bradymonadales bacterium]
MPPPCVSNQTGTKSGHQRLVLLVVGLGTLMSAMSGSSINLALPSLSLDLGITIDLAGWVVTSYLLAVTVLLLVAGRVGDLIGLKPVYLIGYALFGLSSLVCGLAGSVWILVGARVAQGVGGAMVMATGPALLTTTFPSQKRGQALGIVSTATYTGLTIGPPLGGWILAISSWRWVFHLNVFTALLVLGLGLACLVGDRHAQRLPFDWGGMLTLVIGLPLLLIALTQGQRWGWRSATVLSCGGGGLLLLALFVRVEIGLKTPLLDLKLFHSRLFTGSVLSALGNYVSLFIPTILIPFYLLEALELTPSEAGLILSAQPVLMALVASPSGWLSDRIGSRGLATGGLLILAFGLAGLSTIEADTGSLVVVSWLAIMGAGTGLFISPNSSALMGSAPRAQQGVAGGVMAVARSLGQMLGVAVGTTLYQVAGGTTGQAWEAADYLALRAALWVAVAVCLLSALAAALRGKRARESTG